MSTLSLNTNLIALFTRSELLKKQEEVSDSIKRLSSGRAIQSARDNPSATGIAQELSRQIGGATSAARNVNYGVSMLQIADGALSDVSDVIRRMHELSVMGANDTLSTAQKQAISREIYRLRDEVNSIAARTTYNGYNLLTSSLTSEAQVGDFSNYVQTLDVSKKSLLEDSTLDIGSVSEPISGSSSTVELSDITIEDAQIGTYRLTSDGAAVTLTRTTHSGTASQVLTIVEGETDSSNEVQMPETENAEVTLNFSDFDVRLKYRLTDLGAINNPTEFASLIANSGITSDSALTGSNWAVVQGANWDSGYSQAEFPNLKVVITASDGVKLKLGSTSGISSVKGYNGATSDGGSTNGSWTNGSASEIAFAGSQANIEATLDSLLANATTSGKGSVTVQIVPTDISVYTNDAGVTSYYQVFTPGGNISWTSARQAALDSSFKGLDGYLANITSLGEQQFLQAKLNGLAWFGASDSGTEREWRWMDGPEAGTLFFQQSTPGSGGNPVGGAFNFWAGVNLSTGVSNGEPNEYTSPSVQGEDYAHFLNADGSGNAYWNDYNNTQPVPSYMVEYGGATDRLAQTSKVISLGTPSTFYVGNPLEISSISETDLASVGTYKLIASGDRKLTLRHYGDDGISLLESQTLTGQTALTSGEVRAIDFSELGVTVALTNHRLHSLDVYSAESGLKRETLVAKSVRMASTEFGPVLQSGIAVPNISRLDVFRDVRLGINEDVEFAKLFNDIGDLASLMADNSAQLTLANYQALESKTTNAMDIVASLRADIGAMQNRLEYNLSNLNYQEIGLSRTRSQIEDVDYANETARLTRLKIGQEAATAVIAQANAMPNIIASLLLN